MPGRRILGAARLPPAEPDRRVEHASEGGALEEQARKPTLTLYLRAGCHLCEDLETTLYELVDPVRFVLRRVDIDADPVLRERFDQDVPVLMHREHELCRHFLDLEAVQQVLAGYNSEI